jgi:hypothetical protein
MAGVGINPMFSPGSLFSASRESIWEERACYTEFADKIGVSQIKKKA